MAPIGTIFRKYTCPVMGTFLRESSMVVKRAMSCVMRVAKSRCHVVRTMGKWNLAVSRIHLLKMMTDEERDIQVLQGQIYQPSCPLFHAMDLMVRIGTHAM
jgi:hypothetical protein